MFTSWVKIDDDRDNCVNVSVAFLTDADLETVIRRLKQELGR